MSNQTNSQIIPQELKLSVIEAVNMVKEVRKIQHKTLTLRLGQGLSTLLEPELYEVVLDTPVDFFYWIDEEEVLRVFYEYYVDINKMYIANETK